MINNFSGEYEFLSNFYKFSFHFKGNEFKTVEHAYQAFKVEEPCIGGSADFDLIQNADTPGKAKRLGSKVELRKDWEEVKESLMYFLVLCKFSQSTYLANKLLKTSPHRLIEGNTWHDNIWGNCSCKKCKHQEGDNKLGKILMKVRGVLKYEN